jgi:hypothetical protein
LICTKLERLTLKTFIIIYYCWLAWLLAYLYGQNRALLHTPLAVACTINVL